MFVKKMLILQGFPDICTVKVLLKPIYELSDNSLIFFDIETTGLSKNTSIVYLIGAIVYKNNQWILYQWMAESVDEEPLLLQTFSDFLTEYTACVHYNGERFDQPFLDARCRKYGLSSPFDNKYSIDLYKHLKNCQYLWKLENMKQPALEAFLSLPARHHCDGGECIKTYKKYLKTKDPALCETLLGHNGEDLSGLVKMVPLLSYQALFDGNYRVEQSELLTSTKSPLDIVSSDTAFKNQLLIRLQLPFSVPVPVSNGNSRFYLQIQNSQVRLLIPVKNGKLQLFYSNYRQYVYLPAEDSVIPKSLSSYMDRSLYVPATADTCYTWFSCNAEFLQSEEKQLQYLKHALPHFLQSLK